MHFSTKKWGSNFFTKKRPNGGSQGGLAKDQTFSGIECSKAFIFSHSCLRKAPSHSIHGERMMTKKVNLSFLWGVDGIRISATQSTNWFVHSSQNLLTPHSVISRPQPAVPLLHLTFHTAAYWTVTIPSNFLNNQMEKLNQQQLVVRGLHQ